MPPKLQVHVFPPLNKQRLLPLGPSLPRPIRRKIVLTRNRMLLVKPTFGAHDPPGPLRDRASHWLPCEFLMATCHPTWPHTTARGIYFPQTAPTSCIHNRRSMISPPTTSAEINGPRSLVSAFCVSLLSVFALNNLTGPHPLSEIITNLRALYKLLNLMSTYTGI